MGKHIGIIAVTAEGAALCYRTLCVEGAALFGRHAHPEITIHTYPLADYMRHIGAGKWDEVGAMLLASAEKLRSAGAELLICPVNTVHQAVDLVRDRSPLPWLHIAEEVASVAAKRQFRHVIGEARGRGCDAVILGCTEMPLLIGEADSPLPTLDSTQILARTALRAAAASPVAR